MEDINKIRYFNMVIVEFGKHHHLPPRWSYQYLHTYGGLDLIDKNYDIEHTLPLNDTIEGLTQYCKRQGGSLS